MKKIFYNMLLIILLIVPFAVKADVDVDSNGGAITSGSTIDVNTEIRISNSKDYGIRITVVDEDGEIKSARTVDYWQTSFPSSNIKQMPGATFKTAIVNQGGLSYTLLKNFESYAYGTNPDGKLYDANHISGAGTGSWNDKHLKLQEMIEQAISGDSCKNPEFLNDVGFDICKYAENNECEELKKMYVLIEPLVRMHDDNGVYYVFSGTEAANYFPAAFAAGDIKGNIYENNFGGSVYRNLINMYLTNLEDDSLKYRLKSNGAVYAYFTSKPTSSNARYEPSNRMDLFAGKTRDSNENPWGSSMQIVWLGKAAKDCEPKECCIPCSVANVEGCDEDDCCYDEDLPISTDGTTEACIPFDEYWDGHDDEHDWNKVCEPKCIPTPSNNYCCDEPGWCDLPENYDYCEKYCMPEIGKCEPLSIEPEYKITYCDDDNNNNISEFRDGVFNTNNGQFAGYDIEKMEKIIKANRDRIPEEWLTKMATENKDNTFLALAYSSDNRYKTKINDYCDMYCQEIFEVELPDNYPYVNAGRYFKWTIKDSKDVIAKTSGAKLCAVDIDLDKAIDDYTDYSMKAKDGANKLANLTCAGKWGVGPVLDADFADCNAYAQAYASGENDCASDYVCLKVEPDGMCKNEDGKLVQNYRCVDKKEGSEAKYWYAYEGGEHYIPGCGTDGYTYTPSALKLCDQAVKEYKEKVENFAPNTENIYKQIEMCNQDANLLINMNLKLEYETLFSNPTYSTPDDFKITSDPQFKGTLGKCIDNEDECNSNDIFTMSDRADGISCGPNVEAFWIPGETSSYTGINEDGSVSPVDPNINLGNKYYSEQVIMLNVNGFSREFGFIPAGEPYNFSMGNFWNTIYSSFVSEHDFYELNEKINACICKDGEVHNLDNGVCTCEKQVSYNNFTNSYNNYQTLPDGTLKVEFMNPTGLYPISLKYWTIGSVDENGNGHFDSSLTGICDDDGCVYGDSNGKCRLIIKNKIIATPDDNGDCDTPPCDPVPDDNGKCDDEPCADPDDFRDCIASDGNFNCEKSNGLNIIYRVIDLDNPFPGTDAKGRSPGVNWIGHEDIIKNNRGVEGNALYNSNVEPLYSMTLTPALIKEIRAGNQASDPNLGYTSSVMYPPGPAEPGGGYSLFLHQYLEPKGLKINYDDSKQFNDIQKTGDGVK